MRLVIMKSFPENLQDLGIELNVLGETSAYGPCNDRWWCLLPTIMLYYCLLARGVIQMSLQKPLVIVSPAFARLNFAIIPPHAS